MLSDALGVKALCLLFLYKKSGQITHSKPNIFELEELKNQLVEKTAAASSSFLKRSEYYKFFSKILSFHNPNLYEVFLKEFLDDYISAVSRFDVWGIEPQKSKDILEQLKEVSALSIASDSLSIYKNEIERIERQLRELEQVLNGGDKDEDKEHRAFFPLVSNDVPEDYYGILESVTVHISKSASEDKFIIVPSEKEIEKKILEQCKRSWFVAVDLSREYIKKPYKHHEVIISFDKKVGFYEGSSLGIALTISFLEQLLKFYNPTYIIKIKEQTAFTGGMSDAGKVLSTSEEIIKQKVNTVFFSEINTFIIPKCDESHAQDRLGELKKNYSNRKLKLIPVDDISDVLNRRDVVDIRKQKLVVRTGKFVKKNWVSAATVVFLTAILTYFLAVDLDHNPASVTSDGELLYIKNKNGKLLWTLNLIIDKNYKSDAGIIKDFVQIVDINDDQENEILYTPLGITNDSGINPFGSIVCLNKFKKKIWEYTFIDTVFCDHEPLIPEYGVNLIDTCEIKRQKVILCCANSASSFSSAVFALDLKSGTRINKTFWSSGHMWDGLVVNPDSSDKKYFIGIGADNGFHDGAIWGMDIEKLTGYRPTTQEYIIQNKTPAELIFCIRLPKTDFDDFVGASVLGMIPGSLTHNNFSKSYKFTSICFDKLWSRETGIASLHYNLSDNFKDFNISFTDQFRVYRDSLVLNGTLKEPYTNTKEYVELYKKGIRYWKNSRWLKREELD